MTAQVFMEALAGFLLARAEEAEAAARTAPDDRWSRQVLSDAEAIRQLVGRYEYCKENTGPGNEDLASAADEYEQWVLPLLAARYADHSDFRDPWMTGTRTQVWPPGTGAVAAAGDLRPWRPAPPRLSALLTGLPPAGQPVRPSGSDATTAAEYGLLRPARSDPEHAGARPDFSVEAVRQALLVAGLREGGGADTGFWVVDTRSRGQLAVYVLQPGTMQPEVPGLPETYLSVLCAAGYQAEMINPQAIALTEGV
jgi:hypothetical protein